MQPDYIIVQCGTDALAGDPCATFNWSLNAGEGSLGWCMSKILKDWKGKKLLLGGGGYNPANAARAWAYITSIAVCQFLLGLTLLTIRVVGEPIGIGNRHSRPHWFPVVCSLFHGKVLNLWSCGMS